MKTKNTFGTSYLIYGIEDMPVKTTSNYRTALKFHKKGFQIEEVITSQTQPNYQTKMATIITKTWSIRKESNQ